MLDSKSKTIIKEQPCPQATTEENCRLFLSYLTPEARGNIYRCATRQDRLYRDELIEGLGQEGYEAMQQEFPGADGDDSGHDLTELQRQAKKLADSLDKWALLLGGYHAMDLRRAIVILRQVASGELVESAP